MRRGTVAAMTALLLGACSSDAGNPVGTSLGATSDVDAQNISTAAGGVERFTYRIDIPFEWVLTPTEYPCLTETIHLFGSLQEHVISVLNPSSFHLTLHQTTKNMTAVGLTTGHRYQFSGPLTLIVNGSTETAKEITFHNINHFVGHGPDANIYFRTLEHVTFDPATGTTKVEVFKDEVLCH